MRLSCSFGPVNSNGEPARGGLDSLKLSDELLADRNKEAEDCGEDSRSVSLCEKDLNHQKEVIGGHNYKSNHETHLSSKNDAWRFNLPAATSSCAIKHTSGLQCKT